MLQQAGFAVRQNPPHPVAGAEAAAAAAGGGGGGGLSAGLTGGY
jgi:hypothetical protein